MLLAAASAAVTDIPQRSALTVGFVAVFALALLGMRRGWNKKARIQAELVQPHEIPDSFVATTRIEGRFIATTAAGAWLTRVVAHSLGVPSRATLEPGVEGIAVRREGAPSFFIPWHELSAVRTDRAIAGRAFERDGIAVITWKLGDVALDSGFRADTVEGNLEVLKIDKVKQENGS